MAMAGLTWLHLSDWRQKGMEFDRKVVRDAMIEDIKKRRDIHPDLAFSGKKEEYQAAAEHFLAPVLDAAGSFSAYAGSHQLTVAGKKIALLERSQ